MDGTFDKRLLHHFDRRDKAVNALKETFSDAGDEVKSEVKRLTDGTTIEEIIVAHPFIAAGVALGAGVLVSKLLAGGSSSSGSSGVVMDRSLLAEAMGKSSNGPCTCEGFPNLRCCPKYVIEVNLTPPWSRDWQTVWLATTSARPEPERVPSKSGRPQSRSSPGSVCIAKIR